jgi:hypothetical protein
MILHISSGDGILLCSWAKDGVAVINAIAVIVPASTLSLKYRVVLCPLISVSTPLQVRIHSRILNENHLHLQQKFSRQCVAPEARFDASRQDVRGKKHAVVLPF